MTNMESIFYIFIIVQLNSSVCLSNDPNIEFTLSHVTFTLTIS